VQADRVKYHEYMKRAVESQKNLLVKQAEIVEIRFDASSRVEAVVTALGAVYPCKAAVICSGTYLKARIFVGEHSFESGPDGMHAASGLSASLERAGIALRRFKTGTPARVQRESIDFSKLEPQHGDDEITPFSFETTAETTGLPRNILPCHIAYTNERTHEVIRRNLHRSPLYGGRIEGIGARYCPSIEDKVVRFGGKPRHQLFVEPMGLNTSEMYLQGMSSSLPEEVQVEMYRTVEGLENAELMRNAYAIEYDCTDPTALAPTLEFLRYPGLYGAGQFNGTSGYEEAAAQGFVAGVNAARRVLGGQELVLPRSGSYIGTLIDDLVTKGCLDPYRMMTSRSEYRLLLRQDNADERLTPTGRSLGLISDRRWERFLQKQEAVKRERGRIATVTLPPSPGLNAYLRESGTAEITTGTRFTELLKRPQLDYRGLLPFDAAGEALSREVAEQVELSVKYEGYIKKQLAQVEEMHRLEDRLLPEGLDYQAIRGIRLEAREKLSKIRPRSLGQASRISGVSPADISVLLITIEGLARTPAADDPVNGE
jgi:tRNA uridine 5-carboxymethylaminomethyl modification enzyme